MSSVLKALKKLEEERRGTVSTPSVAASGRWASGGQPSRHQRPWLLLAVGVALGLLLAGSLVWIGRDKPRVAAVPAPIASPTPVAAAATAHLEPAKPVEVSAVQPAAPVPLPILPVREASPPVAARQPPARPVPIVAPVQRAVPPTPTEVPVKPVQVDRVEIPAPGQQWVAPPRLTVSEIFPPTGGERMAIVNGLPVMVGTMVEEALVEEIHDDRILVSIGGKRVVLPLGKPPQ